MEKFDLSIWLKDKSRKVVTRDGKEVEILKTNRKNGVHPIIFTLIDPNGIEQVHFCNEQGVCTALPRTNKFDLFFADKKEKLTEFEKAMIQFSHERNSLIQFEHTTEEINAHLYRYSKKLIDLARKELEATDWKDSMRKYKKAYELGKQDALKLLPKWKKVPSHKKQTMYGMSEISDVYYNGYFIHLDDIYKALPKEE